MSAYKTDIQRVTFLTTAVGRRRFSEDLASLTPKAGHADLTVDTLGCDGDLSCLPRHYSELGPCHHHPAAYILHADWGVEGGGSSWQLPSQDSPGPSCRNPARRPPGAPRSSDAGGLHVVAADVAEVGDGSKSKHSPIRQPVTAFLVVKARQGQGALVARHVFRVRLRPVTVCNSHWLASFRQPNKRPPHSIAITERTLQ